MVFAPMGPKCWTRPPVLYDKRSMRHLLLTFAMLFTGCVTNTPPEYRPCRCDVEECTEAACSYQISLDESCNVDVPFAEILVDDHLEQMDLVAGETVKLCSRTEPGDVSVLYVRGGSWIWGPISRKCDDEGGHTYSLVLECVNAE